MKNYSKIIIILAVIGVNVLLFQNCTEQSFVAADTFSIAPVDGSPSTCQRGDEGCTADDDPVFFIPVGSVDQIFPERGLPNSDADKGTESERDETGNDNANTVPPSAGNNSRRFANIVDGRGKAFCDQTAAANFGPGYQCSLGGGCGISCGIPNANCRSANPQHYGLCVNVDSGESSSPKQTAGSYANVVD